MTNFEKVKEMFKNEIDMANDLDTLSDLSYCDYIMKLRNEKNCNNRTCEKCQQWLTQEYKEPILDNIERKYLSTVIKPFRDKVKFIEKKMNIEKGEYIYIELFTHDYFGLPCFEPHSMYKCMALCQRYTVEELGL